MSGQPLWIVVVGAILGTGGAVGGIGAIVGAITSRRLGIQSNERQARADENEAEDRLIGRWREAAEADRARAERAEELLVQEREYSRLLQDWIWRGKPAPPPARKGV